MKYLKKRPFVTYSILWLLGFGLLAVASILIAMTLPMPSADANGVILWAQKQQVILQLADELLVFSAPTLLSAVLLLHHKINKQMPLQSSIMLALFFVLTIGIIYTVFALGRLVYPVNGLLLTPDLALLSASQLFAGLHLVSLALVPCVITIAVLSRSKIVGLATVITALLQVIGTYYAEAVSVPLAISAMIVLFAWSALAIVGLKRYYV
ncbi:hypothetical protein [Streptococcus sp. CSL10205-OR2]|uniref:hypothetical protein n=1 Tax=Streptococcus sp. CSL10205-OR2 TaxID=2980558 RepID=UPI0021D9396F|nr:hypothetical protein [Streptococcus sp. CSL10205-OR2]MCU9533588.1 hypothetical protein [Streptococcus sp. CSL10205-OR2]